MAWIEESVASIKSIKIRQTLQQAVSLGMIVSMALMIWKTLMLITGSESPVVVVLTESMEPGFGRGDILFLHMGWDPIRAGEIVVYNIDGREIPIVHRVIKVHERKDTREVDILTKGDNNDDDDITLYAPGQLWLQQHHIMGRAVGFLPYVGWVTIILTEHPLIKVVQIFIHSANLFFLFQCISDGMYQIKIPSSGCPDVDCPRLAVHSYGRTWFACHGIR